MTSGIGIENVKLRLGSHAFEFHCEAPAAAITALIGPSGAGKSTLLNLVAGFETPDEGRILIAGQDVSGRHPSERPLSLVFQDNNLFAHLDVFTNVGLGISPSLRLSTADRQAITRALARIGLEGFEKRKPGTLSGGERQRVAFARALVRNKPVLLLDEPFAALDPGLRLSMSNLLLDLHRETGNTVLIVSHDPHEVARLADDVIFVEAGQIAWQGTKSDFLLKRDMPALTQFHHE
ncbi:ATP-binding cassette domain-containing protein [Neorhizobium lilium]|uniref:ATP-binding cassette domain-containing protein n=1 Tax=Neorhizobium lilium TaxID=2503024 RepID=A0A444LBK2_9HYPH|nr:ATP-binding cassette domain-containing protein [Neorhizobium lilium]RWX75073.1 ATP-binding cassette domain-containing protein [Neorhizobium lilium]